MTKSTKYSKAQENVCALINIELKWKQLDDNIENLSHAIISSLIENKTSSINFNVETFIRLEPSRQFVLVVQNEIN